MTFGKEKDKRKKRKGKKREREKGRKEERKEGKKERKASRMCNVNKGIKAWNHSVCLMYTNPSYMSAVKFEVEEKEKKVGI